MSDHDDPREVLIFGAGFSKAVSPALPLANRLGQMAYDGLKNTDPSLFLDSVQFSDEYPFEVLLSRLAENQPYLQEAENRENALRFAKLNDAIVSILDQAQGERR